MQFTSCIGTLNTHLSVVVTKDNLSQQDYMESLYNTVHILHMFVQSSLSLTCLSQRQLSVMHFLEHFLIIGNILQIE